MSQRRFTTPRDEVLMGWDRPLQSLFLVITARDTGTIVYSNLDDPHRPGLSLPGVRQRLAHFGITPPARLWDDLAADRRADVGNLCVVYDAVPPGEAGAHGDPSGSLARDASVMRPTPVRWLRARLAAVIVRVRRPRGMA